VDNFKVDKHQNNKYKDYWIIEKGILYFSKEYDKEFFNLFETNEVELIFKNYNCFCDEKSNCNTVFFYTRKEAQRCLEEILMPHAVIEKLIS